MCVVQTKSGNKHLTPLTIKKKKEEERISKKLRVRETASPVHASCVCVCMGASISNSTDVGHVCRQKGGKKKRNSNNVTSRLEHLTY